MSAVSEYYGVQPYSASKRLKIAEDPKPLHVLVLGASGVGKSSMVSCLTRGYGPRQDTHTIQNRDNNQDCLNFLDKQFRDSEMNDAYIRTGDIFCLVFSIDNLQSFEDMLIQLKNIIKLKGNKPIIVIGNKTDESARQVGHAWADLILSCDYNVKYIETSAKYNVNIDTVRLAALSLAKDNGHVVLANVANSVVACPMVAKSKSPSNLRRMISRLRGILQNYQ